MEVKDRKKQYWDKLKAHFEFILDDARANLIIGQINPYEIDGRLSTS